MHSTIPAQSGKEFLQIVYGSEDSIIQKPNSIGHCISADAKMSKGFADFLSHKIPGLHTTCKKAKLLIGQVLPFWDSTSRRYNYNLVTKERFSDKPNLTTFLTTLEAMKTHAAMYGVSTIAIPNIGCGLDQMTWQEVVKLLRNVFAYSDIHVVVYTLESHGVHAMSSESDSEFYAEDQIERHSEEFYLDEKDLETDFTKVSKSCQPPCDEQFPILREKDLNNRLIEHHLQYQPKELVDYIKEFYFQYSDITDEEMTLLIDMLLDSRDVYSRHKFDVGKTPKVSSYTKTQGRTKETTTQQITSTFKRKVGKTLDTT